MQGHGLRRGQDANIGPPLPALPVPAAMPSIPDRQAARGAAA